jgi:hypothetical protein
MIKGDMTLKHAAQLPEEWVPQANPKQVVLCWGIVLLIVIVFNFLALAMLKIKKVHKTPALINHKWKLLNDSTGNLDVLILGDSSGNHAVDPAILKTRLGIESLNLCTTGGSVLLDDRLMLEDYLAKHTPPRVVVLVHVYDVWTRRIADNVLCLFPQSVSELEKRIKPYKLTGKAQASIYVQRYLPIYSQHRSLQSIVFNPTQYFLQPWKWQSNGYDPQTQRDPTVWKDDVRYHYRQSKKKALFSVLPENIAQLDIISALAQKHDMKLLLVMSPISKELYDQPVFQKAYHQVTDQLAVYAQTHPQVQIVFEKPITISQLHMQNADHALSDAASFYTEHLARELKACFDQNP